MNIAFVRVPKTASTYIAECIDESEYTNCIVFDEVMGSHAPVSYCFNHDHHHILMTSIRDPYQRAISGFYQIKKKSPIRYKDAKLEHFLVDEPLHIGYKRFWESVHPKDFDIIGNMDDMERTIKLYYNMLGVSMPVRRVNDNPDKIGDSYSHFISPKSYESSAPNEYELYYQGLERFEELCKEFGV